MDIEFHYYITYILARKAGFEAEEAKIVAYAGPFIKAHWPKWLRIRRFQACPKFKESHWFKFQEAVKEHQKLAQRLYADRYDQLGEELRKAI